MKKIKRIFINSILMSIGILLENKGTYEKDPAPELLTTEYSDQALAGMTNLAYGAAPTLPKVNLSGTTSQENQLLTWGMDLIKKMSSGEMPEAFNLGMDKIKSVLAGEYDPLTSPYYQGLKEESGRYMEKAASDIRQRSQLGGMLYSEPSMGIEAETRGEVGTGLTKELGRLYEADVNRQVSMIPELLNYSGQEVSKQGMALSGIGALSPLAGKSGDITRAEEEANWGVATKQATAAYDYQAPIMESLANWGTWYQPTQTYKPGWFEKILGYGASILGAAK